MTDREKLVELYREAHRKAHEHCNNTNCDECKYEDLGSGCIRLLKADHLLANGVVVREKGEWDDTGRFLFADGSLAIRCNLCGAALHQDEWDKYNWHFCPNCGADMSAAKEKA
jgi:hypothetical protein